MHQNNIGSIIGSIVGCIIIFLVSCIFKSFLIRVLKGDNQLHLFRRLEQCSRKQTNCDGSIECLKLCRNFDLTLTFANVDEDKWSRWKSPSVNFSRDVIKEELKEKFRQSSALNSETNSIYDEILWATLVFSVQWPVFWQDITTHTCKISRLINNQMNLDEHILNISSYERKIWPRHTNKRV